MLRARIGSVIALLCVGLVLGGGACEKSKDTSQAPDASGGPEVIVEDPGAEPEVVTPEEPPEASTAGEPTEDTPAGPSQGGTKIVTTKVPCSADADCVKDSCCHASGCVAPADAPDCSGSMCTMDCRAGTMDCYGGCLCQDGFCAAEIWEGPGS